MGVEGCGQGDVWKGDAGQAVGQWLGRTSGNSMLTHLHLGHRAYSSLSAHIMPFSDDTWANISQQACLLLRRDLCPSCLSSLSRLR